MAGPVYPYRENREQDCGWWMEYGPLDYGHSGLPDHNNDEPLRSLVDLLAGKTVRIGKETRA